MDSKGRLQEALEGVEEVKDIMIDNIKKADEKTSKLGELENRADDLLERSKAFDKTTVKVKQKKLWEHMRMKIILTVSLVVVIAVIFGIIVWQVSPS